LPGFSGSVGSWFAGNITQPISSASCNLQPYASCSNSFEIGSSNTVALVAIQILDGVGAGIFGVVSVLVIADLTQGSGRFNITLGAISTAVGIGAALSQMIAGAIVHHFSFDAGFLFLAAIAATAFSILYFFMPETINIPLNEHL
jgi:MFS family permease